MAIKHFCDICNKEITESNQLPEPDEEVTYNYTVPIMDCYREHNLFIEIIVSRGRNKDHSLPIDVCKNCVKEFINQM